MNIEAHIKLLWVAYIGLTVLVVAGLWIGSLLEDRVETMESVVARHTRGDG